MFISYSCTAIACSKLCQVFISRCRFRNEIFAPSYFNHTSLNQFYCISFANVKGVVHRDVKPGNFLFSRKTNKGYLIDFNLAMVSNSLSPFSCQYFSSNGYWLVFLTIEFEVTNLLSQYYGQCLTEALKSLSDIGTEKLELTQTFVFIFLCYVTTH